MTIIQSCSSFCLVFIVGFTERSSRKVNDSRTFDLAIDLNVETVSERFHAFFFYVLNSSRNATVRGISSEEELTDEEADAEFGALIGGCLVEEDVLFPNETNFFKGISTTIIGDNFNEGVECFTILISSPDQKDAPDIFHCNKDDGAKTSYCFHTVCIYDDIYDDGAGLFS